ncbi:hypothetical protein BJX64DRAFT_104240 [Aspergillus heterothallicus]
MLQPFSPKPAISTTHKEKACSPAHRNRRPERAQMPHAVSIACIYLLNVTLGAGACQHIFLVLYYTNEQFNDELTAHEMASTLRRERATLEVSQHLHWHELCSHWSY